MPLQPAFTEDYARALYDRVKKRQALEKYKAEKFEYDQQQVRKLANIQQPQGLLQDILPLADHEHDLDVAIKIYEAYKALTPLQASDTAFWVYLSHADLFPFMCKRFNMAEKKNLPDDKFAHYLKLHWFATSDWQVLYTIGAYWWLVYLTKDDNPGRDGSPPANPYKYTKWAFRDTNYRTNFLQYAIGRYKEAVLGYFDFLEANPDIPGEALRLRNRFATKYLNKIGGTRVLSCLDRQFFKNELLKIKPRLLAIKKPASKGGTQKAAVA